MKKQKLPHLELPPPTEIDFSEELTVEEIQPGSFFYIWEDVDQEFYIFLRGGPRGFFEGDELIPCYKVIDGRVDLTALELFHTEEKVLPIELKMPDPTLLRVSEPEGQT